MKNEKRELTRQFKEVIEDLLDNYDRYTDEEKAQIKEIFQKVAELNTLFDKYDIDTTFDWDAYFSSVGRCLGPFYY